MNAAENATDIWTFLATPLGIAVVAALGAFVAGLCGSTISAWAMRSTHKQRLALDRELVDKRFEFDKELAERKLALDRSLSDWKRRTELAEQVLSDFYKASVIFQSARYPAFAGEGRTRPQTEGQMEDPTEDAIFVPLERLNKEITFLSDLHARRFRFMALFGAEAAKPFDVLSVTYNQIQIATYALLHDQPERQAAAEI
jgi:hypothetical protein